MVIVVLSLVLLLADYGQYGFLENASADQITSVIRDRLKTRGGRPALSSGEALSFPTELKNFYARRGFHPAWLSAESALPVSYSLLDALQKASCHGLRPEDYHLRSIKSLLPRKGFFVDEGLPSAEKSVDLDFLLTDAFFLYASHLATGRVNPEKINAQWYIRKRKLPNLPYTLEKALASEQIAPALEGLAPSSPYYTRLMAALKKYREIAIKGGRPIVPNGPILKVGDRDERVSLVRERLETHFVVHFWEDTEKNEGKYLFDESLAQAVKAFQQRHGLTADGTVGPETVEALNVPVTERIRQIEINLERRRWMPDDLGDPSVVINIPEFKLKVVKSGKEALTSRIVVGRSVRNTPVFDSRIAHFVLNPYWNVPRSIAVEEILPQIQNSLEYLNWENVTVLSGSGTVIPPWAVDWSKVTAQNFRYQLRQDPGPRNPLGRLKFVFPNSFDVYLHDTPARYLFEREERSFSHGCIRVEHPFQLAAVLLPGDPVESERELLAAAETGKRKQIRLLHPVEIYVLYFTAWVDPDGTIQFRKDIYNYDPLLRDALEKAVPLSGSGTD